MVTNKQFRKACKTLSAFDQPAPATLTDRQRQVFDFIRETILSEGHAPTIREIAAHIGIATTNGVICHLKALEKKGVICRPDASSRGITINGVGVGEAIQAACVVARWVKQDNKSR